MTYEVSIWDICAVTIFYYNIMYIYFISWETRRKHYMILIYKYNFINTIYSVSFTVMDAKYGDMEAYILLKHIYA